MKKEINNLVESIEQNTLTCLICLDTAPNKGSHKKTATHAYLLGWRYSDAVDGGEYGGLCPKCNKEIKED